MTNWKFYSYAMIPDIEPHEIADTDIIKNGPPTLIAVLRQIGGIV